MKIEKCPECGGRRFGWGKFSGYAKLSVSSFASSPVVAQVCSDCGLIVELRVTQPQKFAPKIK